MRGAPGHSGPTGLRCLSANLSDGVEGGSWDARSLGPTRTARSLSAFSARLAQRRRDIDENERREAALKRVKAKRDFRNHLAVYVLVNALLVVIWAASGAGYFWPIWPIAGWGIGLAINFYTAYLQKPISEEEIQREMGSEF